jgi:hypothetical protein
MTEREGPAPTPGAEEPANEKLDEATQREAQSEDPISPERGFDDDEDAEPSQD